MVRGKSDFPGAVGRIEPVTRIAHFIVIGAVVKSGLSIGLFPVCFIWREEIGINADAFVSGVLGRVYSCRRVWIKRQLEIDSSCFVNLESDFKLLIGWDLTVKIISAVVGDFGADGLG